MRSPIFRKWRRLFYVAVPVMALALSGVAPVQASEDVAPAQASEVPAVGEENTDGEQGMRLVFDEDAQLVEATKEVRSFGGAYVSGDALQGETEKLVIWLTEPSQDQGKLLRSILTDAKGPRFDQPQIEFRRAQYRFAELKSWFDELKDIYLIDGVVLGDVDEKLNRLVYVIDGSRTDEARVREEVGAAGVPQDAVVVTGGTSAEQTLRSKHRPMRGGLQIQFQGGFLGLSTPTCTLGYPARRSGVDGFITNSHCSRTQAEVDNGRYWQATRPALDNDQAGTETVDPSFFTGGACPSGRKCRYSDANFVRGAAEIARGSIARIGTSSLTWNGSSIWRITEQQNPALDVVVTKVGRTTGLTSGRVNRTCASANVADSTITMLCQATADIDNDFGDSGSPAFRVTNSPTTHDVAALGILWGKFTENGVVSGIFSRMDNVKSELAGSPLVCASGYTC